MATLRTTPETYEQVKATTSTGGNSFLLGLFSFSYLGNIYAKIAQLFANSPLHLLLLPLNLIFELANFGMEFISLFYPKNFTVEKLVHLGVLGVKAIISATALTLWAVAIAGLASIAMPVIGAVLLVGATLMSTYLAGKAIYHMVRYFQDKQALHKLEQPQNALSPHEQVNVPSLLLEEKKNALKASMTQHRATALICAANAAGCGLNCAALIGTMVLTSIMPHAGYIAFSVAGTVAAGGLMVTGLGTYIMLNVIGPLKDKIKAKHKQLFKAKTKEAEEVPAVVNANKGVIKEQANISQAAIEAQPTIEVDPAKSIVETQQKLKSEIKELITYLRSQQEEKTTPHSPALVTKLTEKLRKDKQNASADLIKKLESMQVNLEKLEPNAEKNTPVAMATANENGDGAIKSEPSKKEKKKKQQEIGTVKQAYDKSKRQPFNFSFFSARRANSETESCYKAAMKIEEQIGKLALQLQA
jgi:hypothetical protein